MTTTIQALNHPLRSEQMRITSPSFKVACGLYLKEKGDVTC